MFIPLSIEQSVNYYYRGTHNKLAPLSLIWIGELFFLFFLLLLLIRYIYIEGTQTVKALQRNILVNRWFSLSLQLSKINRKRYLTVPLLKWYTTPSFSDWHTPSLQARIKLEFPFSFNFIPFCAIKNYQIPKHWNECANAANWTGSFVLQWTICTLENPNSTKHTLCFIFTFKSPLNRGRCNQNLKKKKRFINT